MKKLLLISVVIVASAILKSCASPKEYLDSPDTKIEIIENKLSKNSNYIKANEWMVNTFSDAESVIQFTDKEAGIVKGKYLILASTEKIGDWIVTRPSFYAIITLRVKDGACRIEIDSPSGLYTHKGGDNELGFTPEMFNKKASDLISNFRNYMIGESANDDW